MNKPSCVITSPRTPYLENVMILNTVGPKLELDSKNGLHIHDNYTYINKQQIIHPKQ